MKGWKALSKGKKVGVVVGSVLLLSAIGGNTNTSQKNSVSNQTSQPSSVDVKAQKRIDVNETKVETKTEPIAFESVSQNDATLSSGMSRVAVAGVNGERTITYEVTYRNGVETGRIEKSNEATKQPVTQVTQIGTKVATNTSNCDPNYSPCVPNVSYDLDCADIGFSVTVRGSDPHRFDRDGDGYGCESY